MGQYHHSSPLPICREVVPVLWVLLWLWHVPKNALTKRSGNIQSTQHKLARLSKYEAVSLGGHKSALKAIFGVLAIENGSTRSGDERNSQGQNTNQSVFSQK